MRLPVTQTKTEKILRNARATARAVEDPESNDVPSINSFVFAININNNININPHDYVLVILASQDRVDERMLEMAVNSMLWEKTEQYDDSTRGHGTMAWLPLRVAYRKPEFPAHVNGSADEPTPTTRCEMGWSKSVSTLRCTRTRLCKSKMWLLLLTSPCRRRGAIKAGATPISGPPEQK